MKVKTLSQVVLAAAATALVSIPMAASAAGKVSLDGLAALKVEGTVKSVDVAKRTVTIVDAQGATTAMTVGANVPNLDRLQNGQHVFGTTDRPVHLTVLAAGEQAARMAEVVSVAANVVMLKDAAGESVSVTTADAAKAAALKVGDHVAVDIGAAEGA